MGNLDLIVQMHNNVELTLLPVERPLLQSQLVSSYLYSKEPLIPTGLPMAYLV